MKNFNHITLILLCLAMIKKRICINFTDSLQSVASFEFSIKRVISFSDAAFQFTDPNHTNCLLGWVLKSLTASKCVKKCAFQKQKLKTFFYQFSFLDLNKTPWFWIFKVCHFLPMKQLTEVKLTWSQLFHWQMLMASKIQNYGGSFRPKDGKW